MDTGQKRVASTGAEATQTDEAGSQDRVSTSHSTMNDAELQGPVVIARLLRGDVPEMLNLDQLGDPWAEIAQTVASATGTERSRAFAEALAGLDSGAEQIQGQVYAAEYQLDAPEEGEQARGKWGVGQRLPAKAAKQAEKMGLSSPDPQLTEAVKAALIETRPVLDSDGNPVEDAHGVPKRRRIPTLLKREKAGCLLLDWLGENGLFVQSDAGEPFYFYRPKRQLFSLNTDLWAAWLFAVTGTNPASTDYACLSEYCKAAGVNAPRRPVVRVAAWDQAEEVLRVSRFDGTVYVLDGERIREEGNGENGVIFNDDPLWLPYMPQYNGDRALRWLTEELPNWKDDRELHALTLRAWILSSFCTELCPSRPLAAFCGEKGSGKSAILRLLLRLLFGPNAQISGVPDKPDGFTAAAAAAHILVLDNLDEFTPWLRDKLARIATGADDAYRKLYSNNESGRVVYRCWVAITSRTPDTLRRDDLADRLLIAPVARIEDNQRLRETALSQQAGELRGWFWGDVLQALNQVVARIRDGGLEGRSRLRLADWERLGAVIAASEGQGELWDQACRWIQGAQNGFLLEDDLLVEGLALWMQNEANHGKEMMSRELQDALQVLLFDDKKPPSDWPKSTSGFGRRLQGIRRDLRSLYDVVWEKGTQAHNHERLVYRFWPKGKMPEQVRLEGM